MVWLKYIGDLINLSVSVIHNDKHWKLKENHNWNALQRTRYLTKKQSFMPVWCQSHNSNWPFHKSVFYLRVHENEQPPKYNLSPFTSFSKNVQNYHIHFIIRILFVNDAPTGCLQAKWNNWANSTCSSQLVGRHFSFPLMRLSKWVLLAIN